MLEQTKQKIAMLASIHSQAEIARMLKIPRSTISDFLNKITHKSFWESRGGSQGDTGLPSKRTIWNYLEEVGVPTEYLDEFRSDKVDVEPVRVTTVQKHTSADPTHFVIPDTQCHLDVDMSYLRHIGEYIVDRQPDVIIHLGDHADMPSLSSYDMGRKKAEGKRVYKDIEGAILGMNELLKPLKKLQDKQLEENGKVLYKPQMVLCLGNHEYRIVRHTEAHPELDGFLSYDNLKYKEMGWDVHDFLKPVVIDGICYCHFMPNPMTGKPYGGMSSNILQKVGESFTQGHKQTLDISTRFLPASGRQQWAIIAGACYPHQEDYKGYQGNHHWRGLVVKHNVNNGSYNPMFVDLGYLARRYG